MKDRFINKLEKDEQLLFYGESNVNKTSRQYGRLLLVFIVIIMFFIIIFQGIKKCGLLDFNIFGLFVALILFTCCLIYGVFYNFVLRYKAKNKNEYFITNKRIALYNKTTDFVYGDISNIQHIGIAREKNNYGDVIFNFYSNNSVEQIKGCISFVGVENPRKIVEVIKNINSNIHIYDDRPTIMGKKI